GSPFECDEDRHLRAGMSSTTLAMTPPGRRWRTESPQCWPPSAAQTWCAVFPRHAFTKAHAAALQWKESVSPLHHPILAVQLALRELFPAAVAPAFVPMRPNPSLDPTVEFVEERSDVGTLVIVSPPPQDWVELLDQILGLKRYSALG